MTLSQRRAKRGQSAPAKSTSTSNLRVLAGALPEAQSDRDKNLREDLRNSDLQVSTAAALELGAAYLTVAPDAALGLLRRASASASQLVAGRAHLRLARSALRNDAFPQEAREAEAWNHLQEAQHRTADPGGRTTAPDPEMISLRIDIAVALGFLPGGVDGAVRVLIGVERALREVPDPESWGGTDDDLHRHLTALLHLRLGQIQAGSAPREADRHLELAVARGSGSVQATAALERGRLLEHRADGAGAEIERQYLLAVEIDDPTVSPDAAIALGDFLWENGRPEGSDEFWDIADDSGRHDLVSRVERRRCGQWQKERAALRQAAANSKRDVGSEIGPSIALDFARPLRNVTPSTDLGRIATGRAADAPVDSQKRRPVIVVGAGTGGHYLLPALAHGYRVVGFIDDRVTDPVEGIRVLGTTADLGDALDAHPEVEQVIFAIPTAAGTARLRVLEAVDRCNQAPGRRVAVVALPPMFELRHGHPLQQQLRPLEVHEAFGNRPWLVDREPLRHVRDRRVVIVGASTALGAELARRVALAHPRYLLLVDEAAVPLMDVAAEIRGLRGLIDCDARILDFAAPLELEQVFQELPARPDVVFFTGGVDHASPRVLRTSHAARANVLAAHRVAEAARQARVPDVVLASSDRAGHRAGPFDMTKALGEVAALMQAQRASQTTAGPLTVAGEQAGTRISVLRLPNLWARDGAVTKRLVHQLAGGGPLHVKATRRRFAHAWDAAQTMLRLLGEGHDGGQFALANGDEVHLHEIASRLLLIHGLVAGRDIQIQTIDDPDTKASLLLWGRDETCGAEVVKGALRLEQSRELRAALEQRTSHVLDALRAEKPEGVVGALKPYAPITEALSAKVVAS